MKKFINGRRERWKEQFEEILNKSIPDDPVTDVDI